MLAIAVILPAGCLLWFMTQAVKNERLAIRQKLIDSYTNRAQEIFLKNLQVPTNDQNGFSALVIYDQNDKIIYPAQSNQKIISHSDAVQRAWKLEYADGNCIEAIKEYDKIAKLSSVPNELYECQMGIVRCLSRQDKVNDAIKICYELVYPDKHIINEYTPQQIAYAKLMLVSLYSKINHKDLFKELQNQLSDVAEPAMPTETKIFVLSKLVDLAKSGGLAEKLKTEIEKAQKTIDSALISVAAADYLEKNSGIKSFPQDVFRKIESLQPLYGIYLEIGNKHILGLFTTEKMTQFWQKSIDDFTDELVFCKIYDDKGKQIAGIETLPAKYSQL